MRARRHRRRPANESRMKADHPTMPRAPPPHKGQEISRRRSAAIVTEKQGWSSRASSPTRPPRQQTGEAVARGGRVRGRGRTSPCPPPQARPDDQTSGRSPGGTNQPSFFRGWPGRGVRAAVVRAWAPPRRTQDLTFSTSFQGIELPNQQMATALAEAARQCPRPAVRASIGRGRGTAQGPTFRRHHAGTHLLGRKHYPSPWAAMGCQ